MRIIIPGEPIAKARHRAFIRNGHIATYDPQAKALRSIKLDMIDQRNGWRHEDCPLKVDIIFQLEAIRGASKAEANLRQWFTHFPFKNAAAVKRIDLDNICKTYLDCGNEVLWSDDRYIVQLSSRKVYSNNPCTIITIEPIIEGKMSEEHEKVFKTFSPEDLDSLAADARRIYSYLPMDAYAVTEMSQEQMAAAADLLINFATKWHEKLRKIKEN